MPQPVPAKEHLEALLDPSNRPLAPNVLTEDATVPCGIHLGDDFMQSGSLNNVSVGNALYAHVTELATATKAFRKFQDPEVLLKLSGTIQSLVEALDRVDPAIVPQIVRLIDLGYGPVCQRLDSSFCPSFHILRWPRSFMSVVKTRGWGFCPFCGRLVVPNPLVEEPDDGSTEPDGVQELRLDIPW